MKQIGRYYYADSGKKFLMTEFGLESKDVRKAFQELEKIEDGLGKVPVAWIDHHYVTEVQR